MAELVDAIDSKSIFLNESTGSTPVTGTSLIRNSDFSSKNRKAYLIKVRFYDINVFVKGTCIK